MGSSKGGGDQTIGYWYGAGMHLVIAHELDQIYAIGMGDKTGWQNDDSPVTGNTRLNINQPELFGGEKEEGGIQGDVDIMFGGPTQPVNDYLARAIMNAGPPPAPTDGSALGSGFRFLTQGETINLARPDGTVVSGYTFTASTTGTVASGIIPAFRGVVSLVLRKVWLSAMNPYIKPWKVMARRVPPTLGSTFAAIGDHANPAAMIAEALTSKVWGRGFDPSTDLILDSFTAAAQTLLNENFGLACTWAKEQSVDDFISHILEIIGGYRYNDLTNGGRIGIKLARADYDVNTLLLFDETSIDSISQFSRPDPSDIINQIKLNFTQRPFRIPDEVTETHFLTAGAYNASPTSDEYYHPGYNVPVGFYLEPDNVVGPFPYDADLYLAQAGATVSNPFPTSASALKGSLRMNGGLTGAAGPHGGNGTWSAVLSMYGQDGKFLGHLKAGQTATFTLTDSYVLKNYSPLSTTEVQIQASLVVFKKNGKPNNEIADQKPRTITMHNGASIEQIGYVNTTTLDYPEIPTTTLATRVAMRELNIRSRGLATVKFVANRKAAQLKGGDVFKLSWAAYDIQSIVMRVTDADYGLLTDGRVTITAIEDAFSLPDTGYIGQDQPYVPPTQDPVPLTITQHALFEVPYYVVALTTGDNDTTINSLPAGYGFYGVAAAKRQQGSTLDAWDWQTDHYEKDIPVHYTPYATLTAALTDTEVTSSLNVTWQDINGFVPNQFAFIGDEVVWVTGVADNIVTVTRGVFDTVPAKHSVGEIIWFVGGNLNVDTTTYVSGQQVTIKLRTTYRQQLLDLAVIDPETLTFNQRAERPYPPGNIKLNGTYRPTTLNVNLTSISWVTRNRLLETAGAVSQSDAGITPEAGTTYNVTTKQRGTLTDPWTTLETVTGLTGTSYTPVVTPTLNYVRIEISSTCGGLDSWQTQAVEYQDTRTNGYGRGYGLHYGQ